MDTQVGDHPGALTSGETATLAVVGTHGNCSIPAGATAIAANVTITNPTAPGYLTVFPADAAQPLGSNLNWLAGQQATANHVTVGPFPAIRISTGCDGGEQVPVRSPGVEQDADAEVEEPAEPERDPVDAFGELSIDSVGLFVT